MPIKLLRLGFTESSLLLFYYFRQQNRCDETMCNLEKSLVEWLYTTSGYYDKTIKGNYFDIVHDKNMPKIYVQYMEKILTFIQHSDFLRLCFHKNFNNADTLIHEFSQIINTHHYIDVDKNMVFNFINNKKILIVSPFSVLIKIQIENGNCKKIYNDFPDIKKVYIYTFPYTFFNNGPNNNILETCDNQFINILETEKSEYDSVLISCGAYSCLLAEKFFNIGKNVCTLGCNSTTFFGISSTRHKYFLEQDGLLNTFNSEYWITTIPEEYKPIDYKKIENGCYW